MVQVVSKLRLTACLPFELEQRVSIVEGENNLELRVLFGCNSSEYLQLGELDKRTKIIAKSSLTCSSSGLFDADRVGLEDKGLSYRLYENKAKDKRQD